MGKGADIAPQARVEAGRSILFHVDSPTPLGRIVLQDAATDQRTVFQEERAATKGSPVVHQDAVAHVGKVRHDGCATIAVGIFFAVVLTRIDNLARSFSFLDKESVEDGTLLCIYDIGKRRAFSALESGGGMPCSNLLAVFVKEIVGEGHHMIAVHVLSVAGVGTGQHGLVANDIAVGEIIIGIATPDFYSARHHQGVGTRIFPLQAVKVFHRGTTRRIAATGHGRQLHNYLHRGMRELVASRSVQYLLQFLHTGGIVGISGGSGTLPRPGHEERGGLHRDSILCHFLCRADAVGSVVFVSPNVYRTILDTVGIGGIVGRKRHRITIPVIAQFLRSLIDGGRTLSERKILIIVISKYVRLQIGIACITKE